MTRSKSVRIIEVGPRDGLQNEPNFIATDVKVELINLLSQSGLKSIETGAFVSPKWVPKMADSGDVFKNITRHSGITYSALTPNIKGFNDAMTVNADEVAVFAAASEAFSQKNINCSIDESITRFEPVMVAAKKLGTPVRGYISCVLGCPYQGHVPLESVTHVAKKLLDMGCYEISLGDTIGCGTPGAAMEMVLATRKVVPVEQIAVHFHDTYGQALANIFAVLDAGVAVVDCSVAGLGGCPYANGASGNVATEDVLYMLNGLGIDTGVNIDKLIGASLYISNALGRSPQSRLAKIYQAKKST